MEKEFKGKRILVTGGTGSIGSAIVKELLRYKPYQIRVYSRDETKQFELSHELDPKAPVNFLIGDIRDKERLNMAMENIDIVFHAAAMKHVAACEKNPFEAVKTNIQGTQNVIDCAFTNGVDKVIGISTDKAADPTNVMGCTKLLAEKIMLATYFYKGKKKTRFCFVRFGNVLGSRGSVVPLFIKQAKSGGPVTITDPAMTRFFMSVSQAVNLIFKATKLMKDREIFVLKMPVANIKDLALVVVDSIKAKNNSVDKRIEIKVIGKKNGERVHEKLLTREESEVALETDEMFVITPDLSVEKNSAGHNSYYKSKKAKVREYSSKDQSLLSPEAIKKILLEI
ncbi:MAG: polysaccharide biosynthesis protein [bacterium]|nr:polysaccharide biosynthesis protein [bacterium]